MRRHARASTAESIQGRGGPAAVSALLVLSALFFLAPAADAAPKRIASSFGSTGTQGGQFASASSGVGGVAVNQAGAGGVPAGTVYVADRANHRIQQFNSAGNFVRAWGAFPGTGSGAQNEKQRVSLSALGGLGAVSGGTFTLTFSGQTTAAIQWNAAAAAVDAALEGLSNIAPGDVEVTGGPGPGTPWDVEFLGALAGTDVAQMTSAASLTGCTLLCQSSVTTTQNGGPILNPPEFGVCTVASACLAGQAGTGGGEMNLPASVAVDQADGSVYVLDAANLRVQKFSATGDFLRAFGKNVIQSGKPGDTGTGFEVCTVAADCQAGASGALGGEFASTFAGQLAVDPAGNLYVTDPANKRVQEFSSAGSFLRAFGFDTLVSGAGNAGTAELQTVTVPSDGGTFTLTFSGQTTGPLAATATAAQVEAALNALSTIGGAGGSVAVSGGPGDASGSHPYEVTFGGSLLGENVAQMTASSAGLSSPLGSLLTCAGGPANATLTFQWLRNGQVIAGATSSTYTVAAADAGKAIQCRASAASAEGATAKVSTGAPIVASPYPAIAPPTPGTPTISGAAEAGKKLTCAPGSWTASPTFSFQWLRNGASLGAANGAQTNEYEVQSADLGTSLQCEVSGSNLGAGGGVAVADSTATIALAVAPANTGLPATAPTVTDTTQTATPPVAGDVLSCANGTWTGATAFAYQWLSGGAPATGSGAQTSSYTVVAADAAKALQCQVSAENGQGKASAASANLVAQTPPSPLPPVRPTTAISVTGNRTVGANLTCAHGTWTNNTGIEYTYAWLRNGAAIAGSASGPTTGNGTYSLTSADADTQVQCRITATTPSGSSVAISPTAAAISPSIPTATATLSGAPQASVATTTNGAPAFEVCTVAASCKAGVEVAGAGAFAANQPTALATDASGSVYAVESAGSANHSRVQKFSGAGLTPSVFDPTDLSGTSSTTTPLAVAVDPATGNVEVAKGFAAGATPLCSHGTKSANEKRIVVTSSSGGLIETGMSCTWTSVGAESGINSVNGIAAGPGGILYVSSTQPEQRVYRLDSTGAATPGVTLDDASGLGPHGATLEAEIDPLAGATAFDTVGYHFEYRKEEAGAPFVRLPATDTAVPAAGTYSQTLTGLDANQAYRFRVVVNRQLGSASLTSPEKSFQTQTAPIADLATLAPWPVRDDSAVLRGQLNPNNTETTYRFQYVETDDCAGADFGGAAQTDPGTVSGPATQQVSAELELEPDTSYCYRLVAENELPSSGEGEGKSFRTDPDRPLGSRTYEMVTSADKRGVDAMQIPGSFGSAALISPSGGRVVWTDIATSPNPLPLQGGGNWYVSSRDPEHGWEVRVLADDGRPVKFLAGSADLATQVGTSSDGLVYLRADGSSEQIAPPGTNVSNIRLSADGSHVYFSTTARLLPGDTATAGTSSLYEWTTAAGLRLADLSPNSPCGALVAHVNDPVPLQRPAADGSRTVHFTSPAGTPGVAACQFGGAAAASATTVSDLYLRNDAGTEDPGDDETLDISRPLGANPDFGAEFVGASADGTVAFFVSQSRLTSDDPGEGPGQTDLYRWDGSRHVDEVQKLNVKGAAGSFTVTYPGASGYGTTNDGVGPNPPANLVTNLRLASGAFHIGDAITGTGIAAGTTIAQIDQGAGTLTLSQNATSAGANRRLIATDTTPSLPTDTSASELEDALDALPAIVAGGGSVSVSSSGAPTDPDGAIYSIAFDGGPLAGTSQALIGAAGNGGATATVAPDQVGGPLIRLSAPQPGGEQAKVSSPGGTTSGFRAAIGADGGQVAYFLACGKLIPDQGATCAENTSPPASSQDTSNLYRWSAGQGLSYLATVLSATGDSTSPFYSPLSAVTPDGAALVFASRSQLTGYPNNGKKEELFRYYAPTARIDCVSCAPDGTPPYPEPGTFFFGNTLGSMFKATMDVASRSQISGLSNDGSTVLFSSNDPLLPAASNAVPTSSATDVVFNVYAWHSGHLSLLSTGQSPRSDWSVGLSADGGEAVFLTESRLAHGDGDAARDLYAAKVGGFTEPEPGVPCEAEACRPAASAPPGEPSPPTATFSGPSNPEPAHKKKAKKQKRKHGHKKKSHRKKKSHKSKQRHPRRADADRRTAR
ncbi:MAG TPA: hypothetical protein VG898_08800 [Solirubrobacterales bacterium]|nr:hypothetical protein [Solirubrobacterales bacterium]